MFLICSGTTGTISNSSFLPGLICFASGPWRPRVCKPEVCTVDQIVGNSMFLHGLFSSGAKASQQSCLPLAFLPSLARGLTSAGANKSMQSWLSGNLSFKRIATQDTGCCLSGCHYGTGPVGVAQTTELWPDLLTEFALLLLGTLPSVRCRVCSRGRVHFPPRESHILKMVTDNRPQHKCCESNNTRGSGNTEEAPDVVWASQGSLVLRDERELACGSGPCSISVVVWQARCRDK